MLVGREDLGKIIMAFGVLLLILAFSFDVFYFAVIVVTLYFFYTLYSSRGELGSDILLVALLGLYMFLLAFFVVFIGFLAGLPQAYRAALGAVLLLAGVYLTGYFEKIKR